jgi:hypothetical protein
MAGDHSSGSDARHVAFALGRRDLLHPLGLYPRFDLFRSNPHRLCTSHRSLPPCPLSSHPKLRRYLPLRPPPSVGLQRETADTLCYK